jgi:hypothetical protein
MIIAKNFFISATLTSTHFNPLDLLSHQQLSLDEAVIPWRGRLHVWTYNLGKLMKYGLLVPVVTESTSGYIANL